MAPKVAQGDKEQGKVTQPDNGPKHDPRQLQAADAVQDRLTFAGEDVQHVARNAAGLGTHGGSPEAEQRAVCGKDEGGEQGCQDQRGR